MKVKKPEEVLPQPLKITLGAEHLYDGPQGESSLEPGEYWLLFDAPAHIEVLTDAQLRAKFSVDDCQGLTPED
jgi:hypothetical protein